jgi:hypothetical protein
VKRFWTWFLNRLATWYSGAGFAPPEGRLDTLRMADWRLQDAEFEVTNPRTTGKQLWIPQGSLAVTETAGVISMKRHYVEHDVPAETIRLIDQAILNTYMCGPRIGMEVTGFGLPARD